MKPSLQDFLNGVAPQTGNGGRPLEPKGVFKNQSTKSATALDRTSAEAKRIVDDEADARAEKTARLKAARLARNSADSSDDGTSA